MAFEELEERKEARQPRGNQKLQGAAIIPRNEVLLTEMRTTLPAGWGKGGGRLMLGCCF